jgi:signal transduction histidine kinase
MEEENVFPKNNLAGLEKELFAFKEYFLTNLNASNEKLKILSDELFDLRITLMPIIIKANGLSNCIQQLINKMNSECSFYTNLNIAYNDYSFNLVTEIHIYAIIEEALLNVKKHSNAQSAIVMIAPSDNALSVQISDNGKGFDVMQILKSGKAKGLLGIERRCREMQTSTSIQSEFGNTNILIEIPFKHV